MRNRSSERGMTLLEVLLATFILGICLIGILQGMANCSEVFHASEFVQQAGNVLARGDAAYPMEPGDDPVANLEVSPDRQLLDGWSYERTCEEDEDEDGLFLVRTKVVQGHGGEGNEMECVTLLYCPDAGQGNTEKTGGAQ